MQIFIQGNLGRQVKLLQEDDKCISFTDIQDNKDLDHLYDQNKQIYMLITDNPLVDYGKIIERMVIAENKIFIPIMIDFPYLTIGPVSTEGSEGCFHCYIDRLLQHDPARDVLRDAHRYYYTEENRDFVDIHPADALLISNFISSLKETKDEVVKIWKGKVSRLNLYDRSLISSQVIGVSNCEICSEHQNSKEKSYLNMKKNLEEGVF
ncbi:hypothetical protein [Lysinibacillus sp. NPDC056232]|uniref:hypothetical protein n=1 Tax=Lysinibacillus sp. NPDC056232 TaxID=3345756 RepID=UPI0035DAF101